MTARKQPVHAAFQCINVDQLAATRLRQRLSIEQLKQQGDKLDAASKGAIESNVSKLNEALKTDDVDQINSTIAALEQTLHAMAEHLYKSAGAQPGAEAEAGSAGAGPKSGGDDVIDAEFEKK